MIRRALAPAAVLVLCAVTGLAFAPAFGGRLAATDFAPGRLVVAVLAAVLAPLAVVAVCVWRRWSATVAALAGLAALVLAIVVVVRPGAEAFSGPYRLLTTALPADTDGPALAAVAAVVGLAALIAALVMAYSSAAVLAVLAPLACLVLALALDAAVREPPAWYAIAVVTPVGLAVAALRDRQSARVRVDGGVGLLRRVVPAASTVAVVAVAAVLATMLAPSLPGVRARPADVRALVAPPLVTRTAVSPLQQYQALHDDTLRVRLSGTSSRHLDLLRMVTLDRFDGQFWTTQAHYRRAGHALSGGSSDGAVDVAVRAGEAAPLYWLPQPGRPLTLDAVGLGVDETTGDLAVPTGHAFPPSYRVAGRPAPDAGSPALAGDDPQPLSGPVDASGHPPPADIAAFARQALTSPSGYVRLTALLHRLRGPNYFVDDRPSASGGHGYFRISALLTGAAGIHAGTSEQYASAFAVMARVLGYDARVVLGFRPQYSSATAFAIGGSDVYAWAEVRFAGAGWVTFDATPTALASLSGKTLPPSSAPPPPEGSPTPAPSAGPSGPRRSGHAGGPGSTSVSADGAARTAWVLALLGGLVVVLGAPPTLKAGRRRRRRARPSARAVYGAWQETLDRIVESGIRVRGGMTGGEVAGAAPPIARPYVAALADLLDRAGYAPEPPEAGAPRLAWANAAVIRTELRREMRPLRRVRGWLDPRPLWRR
ncbi:MAG: hypothetical protein DLM57_17150 [Pseudonocardiales bacterium]|nr:MAG: hypothetical protein DLM57_17150 [Pseudonocardiales bacterium]